MDNSKRSFLKHAGAITATLVFADSLHAQCEFDKENTFTQHLEQAVGHSHEIYIPNCLLDNPPNEGYELYSSSNAAHSHTVVLTPGDIDTLANGGVVSGSVGGHPYNISWPTT